MLLLRRANDTGNSVGPRSGKRYAPTLFAREQEAIAANLGKVPLEKAQSRLFATGRIRTMSKGSSGRAVSWIVEA